jgi:RHS repeat-associated protein
MAMSVTYTNFAGRVVSETRGGVEKHYQRDTLGSTAALVDNSGNVTDRFEYWPYGEISQRTGTTPTPFTFVGTLGYFKDILDKMFYVRARYLRPDLARWQTVDPLWPKEQAYCYVMSSPSFLVDPTGRQSLWDRLCRWFRNRGSKPAVTPCSQAGSCVALFCSMLASRGLHSMIKGLGLESWLDAWKLKDLRNAPKPLAEDCCREANGFSGGTPTNQGSIVKWICTHETWRTDHPAFACAKVHTSRTKCVECCNEMFPDYDQDHGFCHKKCGY